MVNETRWRKIDDDLIQEAKFFHGLLVPGLHLGFFMIEKARELLGQREMIDAVAETVKCLPDSIQLMTPCTVGNGWLKVFDYGNFALTLYDKKTKEGVRIWLDTNKIPKDSLLYRWFMRQEKYEEAEQILEEVKRFKDKIFSFAKVKVEIKKEKSIPVKICPKCGETFPSRGNEGLCMNCKGCGYWVEIK